MENLKSFDKLTVSTEKSGNTVITTLETKFGISAKSSIEWNGKTILANYVDKDANGTYDLVYTIVDANGNVEGNFAEYVGVCPTLFKSPDNEPYVSVTDTRTEKELEISVPLINRETTDEPKGNREFAGKYISNVNQCTVFHDIDIWNEKKPDKMLSIAFAKGAIKKKNVIKLDFPKENKIYIHNNEIHLFGKEEKNNRIYLHRQIDETGKEITKRKIDLGKFWCSEALNLSFSGKSHLISRDEGIFYLIEIDENGKCETKELIDIQDEIFNTFQPVQIGTDTFVTHFNTEFSNGWFIIKDSELVEFYYDKGGKGYKDLLSGKIIEIGNNDLILWAINKTIENGYAITFYENTQDETETSKKMFVLNVKK